VRVVRESKMMAREAWRASMRSSIWGVAWGWRQGGGDGADEEGGGLSRHDVCVPVGRATRVRGIATSEMAW
jgi:hypothetical protein